MQFPPCLGQKTLSVGLSPGKLPRPHAKTLMLEKQDASQCRLDLFGHDYDPSITTTTRPGPRRSSRYSCASAIADKGKRLPISNPGHPASNAAFNSRAAATFASAGKSSLPRKNTRMFLNTSSQNGTGGRGSPVA